MEYYNIVKVLNPDNKCLGYLFTDSLSNEITFSEKEPESYYIYLNNVQTFSEEFNLRLVDLGVTELLEQIKFDVTLFSKLFIYISNTSVQNIEIVKTLEEGICGIEVFYTVRTFDKNVLYSKYEKINKPFTCSYRSCIVLLIAFKRFYEQIEATLSRV
jgi:hypothetical protein